MQRFRISTVGCKVNQYDSSAISSLLARDGWVSTGGSHPVDLLIINTCCVTKTAMRKTRQAIARAARSSPGAGVLVVGCYGDYDPDRIQKLLESLDPPVGPILIAGHRGSLSQRILRFARSLSRRSSTRTIPTRTRCDDVRYELSMKTGCQVPRPATSSTTHIRTSTCELVKDNVVPLGSLSWIDGFPDRQRAFVKVQDGCDAFCTYCIVPYLRSSVWSRSIASVEAEARRLVAAGHKEIVLCGVFLGAFGRGTAIRRRWARSDPPALVCLLERIAQIEGLWRVRLSSLEPGDVSDELLGACRETEKFAPHFHLPLQSGSPRILRRMNRQYSPDEYRLSVDRIREAFDRPAITTDVIVGFPGEDEKNFCATLEMARYAGFSKIHAFPFSPIEGTAAWRWRAEAPPREVVRERIARLRELESQLARRYRNQFLGQAVEGLVERARRGSNGWREALTDRYLRIRFRTPGEYQDDPTGRIVRLRVEEGSSGSLEGVLLEVNSEDIKRG